MTYLVFKRTLDILLSGLALLVCLPLFIPIILILSFTGEREVFYLQKRIGYKNKPFNIWKFATMLKNSPKLGTGDVTIKNDPRVLPIGKFLRKTKINELPQIINVLIGDMSLVGARPLVDVSFNQYAEDVKAVIYATPPGITGIGSLIFRDEENIIANSGMDPRAFYEQFILPYKGAVEKWYQANKSTWVDIQIIFLTAYSIFFPHNRLVYKAFKSLPEHSFLQTPAF